MIEFEVHLHSFSRKVAAIFDVSHTSVTRTLEENKMHQEQEILEIPETNWFLILI